MSAEAIIAALREHADPVRAEQEKRYLKSDLEFLGVTVPQVRKIITTAARGLGHDDTVALARALWDDRLFERRLAAVEVLKARTATLGDGDLPLIEELIRKSAGWALVDVLSGDIAGRIALTHDRAWRAIDRWAADPDLWVRRSALLALLPGIRAGVPRTARLERYAIPMLTEKEFFIRKAIGWVLRELSKQDPDYVIAFTREHRTDMSGLTYREAVRHLPATLR